MQRNNIATDMHIVWDGQQRNHCNECNCLDSISPSAKATPRAPKLTPELPGDTEGPVQCMQHGCNLLQVPAVCCRWLHSYCRLWRMWPARCRRPSARRLTRLWSGVSRRLMLPRVDVKYHPQSQHESAIISWLSVVTHSKRVFNIQITLLFVTKDELQTRHCLLRYRYKRREYVSTAVHYHIRVHCSAALQHQLRWQQATTSQYW